MSYWSCLFFSLVHTPGLIPPQVQQPHLHAHHKSASFGGNLYQQANNFPPRPPLPTQVRATRRWALNDPLHFSFNKSTLIHLSRECLRWTMPMLLPWVHLLCRVQPQRSHMTKCGEKKELAGNVTCFRSSWTISSLNSSRLPTARRTRLLLDWSLGCRRVLWQTTCQHHRICSGNELALNRGFGFLCAYPSLSLFTNPSVDASYYINMNIYFSLFFRHKTPLLHPRRLHTHIWFCFLLILVVVVVAVVVHQILLDDFLQWLSE